MARPRKPPNEVAGKNLPVRLTEDQDTNYRVAAKLCKLRGKTTWAKEVLDKEVKNLFEKTDKKTLEIVFDEVRHEKAIEAEKAREVVRKKTEKQAH
ncbi:hypothetical protein [Pseudoalteromonas galatheae]|uniref:hypothetical protein n=1 Tax=Pseudoalteromonas galatheae TaxID=579562 RepID=UPI0030CFD0EF